MNKLSNLLSTTSILTEANDDLFDIDKEVDAQIKRVEKRVERKNQEAQEMSQEDQQENEISNASDESESTEDNQEYSEEQQEEDTQNVDQGEQIGDQASEGSEQDTVGEGGEDYNQDNSQQGENVPEDYEPKQTIPELKILSTLSDSEYALCNIKIMEQFKELQNNVESTINNILMNITTRNDRQVQIVEIVHNNLHEMIQDINTYILYRNNDIYEENVRTYLTYLKRYDIAMKLIKAILEENKESQDDKNGI